MPPKKTAKKKSTPKKLIADQELQRSIIPMHDAKGLEFRSVAIVACNENVIPLESRTEVASDMHELQSIQRLGKIRGDSP